MLFQLTLICAQNEKHTPIRSKIPPYEDSVIEQSKNVFAVQYYNSSQVPPNFKENLFSFSCYFDYKSKDYNIDSIQKFKKWINQFTDKKNISISLVAFTDTIGSLKSNELLAKNRLKTIENILKTKYNKIDKKYVLGEKYNKFSDYNHLKFRKVDVVIEFDNDVQNNPQVLTRMQVFEAATTQTPINLNIQFVGNQDVYLNQSSMLEVMTLIEFLKKNPNKKAFIRGHVCCANDVELSNKRALAVYNDLLFEGIEKSRISYEGFGNSLPISPEFDEETRQLNRRVDVIFSEIE